MAAGVDEAQHPNGSEYAAVVAVEIQTEEIYADTNGANRGGGSGGESVVFKNPPKKSGRENITRRIVKGVLARGKR
jgi:hypothetical protein